MRLLQLASVCLPTGAIHNRNLTTVVGNLRDLPGVPSLEELNRRLENNPELARWTTELEQRRAALKLEKSRAIPDLTAGLGYRRLSGSDDNALVGGISIPLPLFNRNQGNIREAEYRLARAGEEATRRRSARADLTWPSMAELRFGARHLGILAQPTFCPAHRKLTKPPISITNRAASVSWMCSMPNGRCSPPAPRKSRR